MKNIMDIILGKIIYCSVKIRKNLYTTRVLIGIIYGAIFFKDIKLVIVATSISLLFVNVEIEKREQVERRKYNEEIVDFLTYFKIYINSGLSVKNAILKVFSDKKYESKKVNDNLTIITDELVFFDDLVYIDYETLDLDQKFKNILKLIIQAYLNGNKVIETINMQIELIKKEITFENKINLKIANKSYEYSILEVIPAFFCLMLRFVATDYIKPLYEDVGGIFIMYSVLIVIFFSKVIFYRILKV